MIRYARQLVAYLVFAVFVVAFANGPEYRLLLPDEAIVSLTFSHAGERIGECRRLSQDELNELAPNMRKPSDCPRERHPVHIRLSTLTGDPETELLLIDEMLRPSGIWSDGKANVYRRITMQSGNYFFLVKMNDSGTADAYDIERTANVSIKPGQNLVISFDELLATFTFE